MLATLDEDFDWALRSEYWIDQSRKLQRKRRVRERNSHPLILTGHGTSLRIDKGSLLIRQGFTHYPQEAECFRFFKGDLALPRLIMLLDGSGSISFDVLNWLGEQGVALARIQWNSEPAVYASGAGFIANPDRLRWQYKTQQNEGDRINFARDLICRKLRNSIATLDAHVAPSPKQELALAKAHEGIEQLRTIKLNEMDDIRAIEGECAARYFAAWSAIELRWIAQSKYPVPDNWKSYRSRSSILTGRKARNWKASHPINAMLNYAYAAKVAQLQIEAVAEGYDPFAGIMHHRRTGFPAYAYDLIEPERPRVDAAVLAFIRKRKFSGADFILRKDGACRLPPQLARAVAMLVSDYR
jgi:CRISPR-associated endonuclease Cas1